MENERRFTKVVFLLLLNVVFFILPQRLEIGIRSVNIWCEYCLQNFENPKVGLFQIHFFPLFRITTPLLYLVFIPKYRRPCRSLCKCWKLKKGSANARDAYPEIEEETGCEDSQDLKSLTVKQVTKVDHLKLILIGYTFLWKRLDIPKMRHLRR